MAKRKTTRKSSDQPSKSAAIVEQVQQNPEASNAEVAEALNAQYGWDVTSGYVSTIKSQKGLTGGRKRKAKRAAGKPAKQAGRPKADTKSDVSLSQLKEAQRLAKELGGIEQAKKTLDALAGLQG